MSSLFQGDPDPRLLGTRETPSASSSPSFLFCCPEAPAACVTPHLIPVAAPGLGPSWGRKAPVPWSSECLDVWLWGAAPVSGWPGAQGPATPDRPVSARPAPRGGPGRAGQGPEPRPFSSIAGRHLALCAPRAGPSLSRAHQAGVLSGSRELLEF